MGGRLSRNSLYNSLGLPSRDDYRFNSQACRTYQWDSHETDNFYLSCTQFFDDDTLHHLHSFIEELPKIATPRRHPHRLVDHQGLQRWRRD